MFLYAHLTPPTICFCNPFINDDKNRAVFNFVFPYFPSTTKNISVLFATPHSPSHTHTRNEKKSYKKIFDRVRVVSICVHLVDPPPPAQQKKKEKKSCWHYTCCLYNNIVVTSSVSNLKKNCLIGKSQSL
jgi:hypothetical protein